MIPFQLKSRLQDNKKGCRREGGIIVEVKLIHLWHLLYGKILERGVRRCEGPTVRRYEGDKHLI
jgi:hypothetical protein